MCGLVLSQVSEKASTIRNHFIKQKHSQLKNALNTKEKKKNHHNCIPIIFHFLMCMNKNNLKGMVTLYEELMCSLHSPWRGWTWLGHLWPVHSSGNSWLFHHRVCTGGGCSHRASGPGPAQKQRKWIWIWMSVPQVFAQSWKIKPHCTCESLKPVLLIYVSLYRSDSNVYLRTSVGAQENKLQLM